MQMIQLMGTPSVDRQELGTCVVQFGESKLDSEAGAEFQLELESAISEGQNKEVDPNGLIAQLIALDFVAGPPNQSIDIGKLGFSKSGDAIRVDPTESIVRAFADNYNQSTGEVDFARIIRQLNKGGMQISEKFGEELSRIVTQGSRALTAGDSELQNIGNLLLQSHIEPSRQELVLVTSIIDAIKAALTSGNSANFDGAKPGKLNESGISFDPDVSQNDGSRPAPNSVGVDIDPTGSKETVNGSKPVPISGVEIPAPMPRPNLFTGSANGQRQIDFNGSQPVDYTGSRPRSTRQDLSRELSVNFNNRGAKAVDLQDGKVILANLADISVSAKSELLTLNEFTEKFANSLAKGAEINKVDQVAKSQSVLVDATTEVTQVTEAETVLEMATSSALNKGGRGMTPVTSERLAPPAVVDAERTPSVEQDSEIEVTATTRTSQKVDVDTSASFDPQSFFSESDDVKSESTEIFEAKSEDTFGTTFSVAGKEQVSKSQLAARAEVADRAVSEQAEKLAETVSDLIAARRPASVKIELNPQDLGTIEIAVKQIGRFADVELRASDEGVRQSLHNHRQDLVQSIESRGTSLGSLNVGHHDGQQAGQNQNQGQRDSMRESLNQASNLGRFGASHETPASPQPSFRSVHAGRVDYSA